MPAIQLSPAVRKEKRGDAHHLDPVVMIGADGLTPAILKETDLALKSHGLIKVRVFSDDRAGRETMLATLADQLNAAPIQHIGKLLVLWRPMPPKAAKVDDSPRKPGSRTVKLVTFSKSGSHRAQVKTITVHGNQRLSAGGKIKRAEVRQVSVKKKAQSQ
ncbi:MAG: YhbY family RNA-binding protein [Vitreoscilla sp.]|nr:YhbY family RNA-binding protein [Burkholderiales bacterium]MBP6336198.1 YhbY family RNA-binding protein [Vitreoscilla sp.]MBP6673948.1 YhbY family RNA-binding protein [Vitreoscilla sp.]